MARGAPSSDEDLLAAAEEMARALDVRGLERLTAKPVASLVLLDRLLAETEERKRSAAATLGRQGGYATDGAGSSAPAAAAAAAALLARTASQSAQPASETHVSHRAAPALDKPIDLGTAPTRVTSVGPKLDSAGAAPSAASGAVGSADRRPSTRRVLPRAFRQGVRSVRPALETFSATMDELAPGSLVPGSLARQMTTVLTRFQAREPPSELGTSHRRACGGLARLLSGWMRAASGEPVLGVADDPMTVYDAKKEIADFLAEFDRFEAGQCSSHELSLCHRLNGPVDVVPLDGRKLMSDHLSRWDAL